MMRRAAYLAAGFLTAAALVGHAVSQTTTAPQAGAAAAGRGQAIEGIVALVNDEVISQTDLRNRARLIMLSFPQQPDEQVMAEVRERALQTLIEEKVQLKEFRKLVKGQEISDEEINQELGQLAAQNKMSLEQFMSNLTQGGINPQTLREQVKAEIAWGALIRGRFGRQIRVSELRIDEMLRRLQDSLDEPQYRIAEIFLYAPDATSRVNAMNSATTLATQIQQGASFEAIAQQFSAAPSASAGGDLGWISRGDLRPEIAAATEGATPPSLLPPVESEGGVYLIAYIGKREAADLSNVMVDLKQVSAQGADATTVLNRLRTNAKTCREATALATTTEGASIVDLNGMIIPEMTESLRTALEPLDVNQSTAVMDNANGGKSVYFVCTRSIGGTSLPTREQIRNRLFETEITMLSERYLRDLKREATIILR